MVGINVNEHHDERTVRCVCIGASESLYSPVTSISLWTSSLRHFLLPADNLNDKQFACKIKDKEKVDRSTYIAAILNICYRVLDFMS